MIRPLFQASADHIRLHLLVVAAGCFMVGAVLARSVAFDQTVLVWLSSLALSLFLGLFMLRKTDVAPLVIVPVFLLAGLIHTGSSLLSPTPPDHIVHIIQERSRVTLTGTLLSMPESFAERTRLELEADGILIHPDHDPPVSLVPTRGKVRLTVDEPGAGSLVPGDRLMVLADLKRIYNTRTPGVFDFRIHMADRGIHVTGRVRSLADIIPFADRSDSALRKARYAPERVRQQIGRFLDNTLAPEQAALYRALLIGSRATVPERILEQFKATGSMHLLAISGLHMGLLGLLSVLFFTWLLKRSTYLLLHTHVPTLATLLSVPLLVGYGFIAGMNTPVLRALVMALLFLVGIFLRRQRSIVTIIAAAAIILLLFRPLAIYTVSFHLSFSAVLAIALIYPRLLAALENSSQPKHRISRYVLTALAVSFAATLGSLPFLLLHFNRISFIGPLMTLLVEPLLCFWALPLGLFASILIPFAPGPAALLFKLGAYGLQATDHLTRLGSSFPLADAWTVTPATWQIILYFLLLFVLLSSRISRSARLGACGGILLLSIQFTSGLWLHSPSPTTETVFLDVGQGSSTYVSLPEGLHVLIDGGTRTTTDYDVGEKVIAPFLWHQGVWRLDDLVITHPDSDHYNGLYFIIERFKPRRLWINGDGMDSPGYTRLLDLAKSMGVAILEPATGEVLHHGASSRMTFLTGARSWESGMPADSFKANLSVNDRSLVVKLSHGSVQFLFPGDLGIPGEQLLLASGADLRAKVLLAGHHGSRGSSGAQFIAAVKPELIIVSSGRNRKAPYLAESQLVKWRKAGKEVLATALQGTVTCSTDGNGLHVRAHEAGESVFQQQKSP